MTIPSVMTLEMVKDSFRSIMSPGELADAIKEHRTLGDARLQEWAAQLPESLTAEERGYLMGLVVDRLTLMMMPAAIQAGVTL